MNETASAVADLMAEDDELFAVLEDLADSDWSRQTPAPGWTIAHQVAHLTVTDTASIVSATAAVGTWELMKSLNRRQLRSLLDIAVPSIGFGLTRPIRPAERRGVAALVDQTANYGASRRPSLLLDGWQERRHTLAKVLGRVPDQTKLTWIGPPMRAATMAAARLMETFAHGAPAAEPETPGPDRPRSARWQPPRWRAETLSTSAKASGSKTLKRLAWQLHIDRQNHIAREREIPPSLEISADFLYVSA